MPDDSFLKEAGIATVCLTLLGGVGWGLKWIGQKIWDLMLKQIKERIEQMEIKIQKLENALEKSKERECRFYDCPEGRPCAKIVRSFTMEDDDRRKREARFLDPQVSGDGSVVVRKEKK